MLKVATALAIDDLGREVLGLACGLAVAIALGLLLAVAFPLGLLGLGTPSGLLEALWTLGGLPAVGEARMDEIPSDQLQVMRQVAAESPCGLDWQVLAAVARVESVFGRHGDQVSSAGAYGYGQFIEATWAAYSGGIPWRTTDPGQAPSSAPPASRACGGRSSRSSDAEVPSDGGQHQGGVAQGRQIHEGEAVAEHVGARAATSIARRVLPTPPGPVSVSNRLSPRRNRDVTASTTPAADQRGERARQVAQGLDAERTGGSVLAASGGQQPRAVLSCEFKRAGQQAHGLEARRASVVAFQVADGLGAQARALRQRLLRQARGQSELLE